MIHIIIRMGLMSIRRMEALRKPAARPCQKTGGCGKTGNESDSEVSRFHLRSEIKMDLRMLPVME